MLVNHLVKRHPTIPVESVPELNQPIVKETKNYYCQYCSKVYKSSSKRKVHIKKHHPGAQLPPSARESSRGQSNLSCEEVVGDPALSNDNPTFSATVGSVEVDPHKCNHCHKQYASNAKLLQHMRSKHPAAIQQLEGAAAGDDQNDSGQIQYHQAVDAENNQIHQQVVIVRHYDDDVAAGGSGLIYRTIDGDVLQLAQNTGANPPGPPFVVEVLSQAPPLSAHYLERAPLPAAEPAAPTTPGQEQTVGQPTLPTQERQQIQQNHDKFTSSTSSHNPPGSTGPSHR